MKMMHNVSNRYTGVKIIIYIHFSLLKRIDHDWKPLKNVSGWLPKAGGEGWAKWVTMVKRYQLPVKK